MDGGLVPVDLPPPPLPPDPIVVVVVSVAPGSSDARDPLFPYLLFILGF